MKINSLLVPCLFTWYLSSVPSPFNSPLKVSGVKQFLAGYDEAIVFDGRRVVGGNKVKVCRSQSN